MKRRDFIKGLLASGVAASVAPQLAQTLEAAQLKLPKTGIISYGAEPLNNGWYRVWYETTETTIAPPALNNAAALIQGWQVEQDIGPSNLMALTGGGNLVPNSDRLDGFLADLPAGRYTVSMFVKPLQPTDFHGIQIGEIG